MSNQNLPFLPFTRPTLDENTLSQVMQTFHSGWLASGPRVLEFEQALSDYLGGERFVRTLTSATAGLEVALQLIDLQPNDEVITPALSFTATPNVIIRQQGRPVFVDVDLKTRNIDLDQVEKAITPQTKAIMPVHFAGLPIDMHALYALADQYQLRVIEDAAHAIGSAWQGQKIGSFGDIVSFSFHPNKNMTTIEGGALSVQTEEEAKRIDVFRFHGIQRDSAGNMDVITAGGKYNLSDVAATVGLGQLKQLDAFNQKRLELALHYFKCFEQAAIQPDVFLPEQGDNGHSWHMFTVLLPFEQLNMTRQVFIQRMQKEFQIGLGVHYPALHLFSLYREYGYHEGCFPYAERIGQETVTLPLFPTMTLTDVERVVFAIKEIFSTC